MISSIYIETCKKNLHFVLTGYRTVHRVRCSEVSCVHSEGEEKDHPEERY